MRHKADLTGHVQSVKLGPRATSLAGRYQVYSHYHKTGLAKGSRWYYSFRQEHQKDDFLAKKETNYTV